MQLSRTQAYKGRFSESQGVISAEPLSPADALLAHLRDGFHNYTYASCVRCAHSELAHNTHGCEGIGDDGLPCECQR